MKNIVKILIFACVALWAQTNPLNLTTAQVVKDMGLGINLGNTFESNGDWINGTTVNAYETAWGSPTITKAMIDGYANNGFKTVRIPVAWSNLMTGNNNGGTYTISTALLNRIEEVVDWVLADNMYAIVNIHQDGGWWTKFSTDSTNCMKKYIRIWEQITAKFKDKSGYLVFESLNEEGKWQDVWNMYDGSGNKARAYGLLNAINQKFVDIVRTAGSNNANRHLLIAGYDTNIDRTSDAAFKMPTDSKNRQAVSVHYYDPFGFTHIDKDGDWTPYLATWGTQSDINSLNTEINKMKTNFVDKGIPVIVGEYGFASKLNASRGRTQSQVTNYTLKVAEAIYTRNMCPVLWDIQLNPDNGEVIYYYNRKSNPPAFADPQFITGLKNLVGVSSSSSRAGSSSSSRAVSSSSIASSSSSSADLSSSSSEEDTEPILHSQLSTFNSQLVSYYTIKGVPLGNAKPQKAGVYIVKQGSSIRKIAVR